MTTSFHWRRDLYIHDNLPVLRSLDSENVDLIYLDPPFNSGKQWESPIGGKKGKAVASFKDTWSPTDNHADELYELHAKCPQVIPLIRSLWEINGGSWWAYLIYMAVRLVEMRRILKPTGSIYYHCDPTMSHGVKLVMDGIFGGNLRNEIVWGYPDSPSAAKKDFPRKHDIIFRYSKTGNFTFNGADVAIPYASSSINRIKYAANKSTVMRGTKIKLRPEGKTPPTVWMDIKQAYRYRESTGYPTQKPVALLARIIKASSNKGDVVLDPFCGCGTTMVAAQKLKRNWIGIDISDLAATILTDRTALFSAEQDASGIKVYRRKLPKRTDLPKLPDKDELRAKLYEEQKRRCAAPCGENGEGVKIELRQMHLDHKIARARGGQDVAENLQLLCPNCNAKKGADGETRFRNRLLREAIKRSQEAYRRKTDKRYADFYDQLGREDKD